MVRGLLKLAVLIAVSGLFLAACGKNSEKPKNEEVLHIVTTFSILDIVSQVGGDRVEVHSMVPIGTDPHQYEPLPEDIKKATNADALFYNGLNLEGGKSGWFFKLLDSIGRDDSAVFEVMKGVEPKYIASEDGSEEQINPHAFLDPIVGMKMVENTRDALIQIDPEFKETYEKNAKDFLEELQEIDELYKTKIAEIPEEKRILITSERAFQYMTDRYGLGEGYIWAIDTEEQGTPKQITSLVHFIKEKEVPVLFVESNVDKRPMETVSKETGVEIYAELFSDALGETGEDGDTYIKFLKHNIGKIHEGLMK